MPTPVDRMAAAMSAVALVERPHDHDALRLLPATMDEEACTLLSSVTWCARFLAEQLAEQMCIDTTAVLASLRQEVNERFANYQPPQGDTE
ncbi:hypothetical protein [Mycolicibacterium setense]